MDLAAFDPGGDRRSRVAPRAHVCTGKRARRICASPAAWRSTASPTAACCAKGRSKKSGSSRRRAMPAARSARRWSPGTSSKTNRASADDGRRDARVVISARGSATTRFAGALDASRREVRRLLDEDELFDAVAEILDGGERRRLVPGPDGVRAARAWAADHHRRSRAARRCSR